MSRIKNLKLKVGCDNSNVINYYLDIYNGKKNFYKKKYEHYRKQEDLLIDLFKKYKSNDDFYSVLLKGTVLNEFYSTNILSMQSLHIVANKIIKSNIDERIKNLETKFVTNLCKINLPKTKNKYNFYSFATKYCCKIDKNNYPIYDSHVKNVLLYYKGKKRFSKKYDIGFPNFNTKHLKNYNHLKKILDDFKAYYKLLDFGYRELDHFLWVYGKEVLSK